MSSSTRGVLRNHNLGGCKLTVALRQIWWRYGRGRQPEFQMLSSRTRQQACWQTEYSSDF